MKIDGSCHCGQITFEAEADPANSYICNCTDCQTLAGSAFRWSITVREEDFTLTSGEPKIFIKKLESGETRSHQVFCPDCGSPIYSTTPLDGKPRFFNIRVPGIRQSVGLMPQIQYWKNSAPHWLKHVDHLKDEGGVTL